LDINIPDSDALFDNTLFHHMGFVSKGRFIQPLVEAEIAFEIGSLLGDAELSVEDVVEATDYAYP
tara:strand:+ start:336 stop:530 length:195 start_codon:yes stop_codon:yes gene_type:complete